MSRSFGGIAFHPTRGGVQWREGDFFSISPQALILRAANRPNQNVNAESVTDDRRRAATHPARVRGRDSYELQDKEKMANRLIDETSPYLLQHAHNPVDWYPWGPEALERAVAEDKPILLSVGYSACHWCHVMERESFENREIAAVMNEHFVSIKVDREERPDIDSIYMSAVQAMTGSGGWPMTVFLTPKGEPFYGGTYFPPADRTGMPGFPRVLEAMATTYREKRGDVTRATETLVSQMRQMAAGSRSQDDLAADVMDAAFSGLAGQFDDKHGGFGLQPKFPQPMTYEFLLRHHARTGDASALEMVELTLDRMATGGIYDQLGGGFHRYSTDTYWLVPHFEKMLYDNALLARLYLHAYQVTGKQLYRRVVEETLDYVLREMTDPSGGFYSAQDADSEGVEGKFFVWRPEEVVEVLGQEDGETLNRYYGVTKRGNFEGHSILNVKTDPALFARESKLGDVEFAALLENSRGRLLDAREPRVHPERDDKVLTAWNGLTMAAFAEAGAVFERDDYTAAAERNAAFVLQSLREGGRLLRTWKAGRAGLNGYLEDYAFLINGLLVLHEATLRGRWLREAIDLGDEMVELFWDEDSEQFYDTGTDHERLLLRPKDIQDNAIPAGSSMAADVLLRLATITGEQDLETRAVTALRAAARLMAQAPAGAGHWLCALDFHLGAVKEIVIVGERDRSGMDALAHEVFNRYLPNHVLVGKTGEDGGLEGLPLLEDRTQVRGQPTAYVCRNYVCDLPVNEPEALARQLAATDRT
jgi:uncharacterized protein YyaL (SSP411 family)